jgi:serine/threonine protein phosphatase PrpC
MRLVIVYVYVYLCMHIHTSQEDFVACLPDVSLLGESRLSRAYLYSQYALCAVFDGHNGPG